MSASSGSMLRRLASLAAAALWNTAASAQSPPVVPSDQIIERLTTAPAAVAQTRSLRKSQSPPVAGGHRCDPEIAAAQSGESSRSIAAPTRNLYRVEAATIDLDVQFDLGSSTLLPEGRRQLDQLAAALGDARLAAGRFVVAGHTDARGSTELNDTLSCQRALAVRDYLGTRAVAAARLVPMGFGSSRLKDEADPLADRNRRVEVRKIDN